jgi:DNA-binding NarL/FixJ family response regulator
VPDTLRVLLVGDDPLARSALAALLAHDAGLTLSGQGAPGEANALQQALDPDVILWDVGLARSSDDEHPDLALAAGAPLLALVAGAGQVAEARLLGARGILRRDSPAPRLLTAIRAVAEGLSVFDDASTGALQRPAGTRDPREPVEPLTPREHEVLQLLGSGHSNKEIAQRLSISEHTAKFHVAKLLQKLGAESRSEAVFIGARLGLLLM